MDNQPMDDLGKKIKAAISAKGITQAALAEQAGVSNNAVTKWIKTGKVSKRNIPKLIELLGMKVSDFYEDAKSMDGIYVTDDQIKRGVHLLEQLKAQYRLEDALDLLNSAIKLAGNKPE